MPMENVFASNCEYEQQNYICDFSILILTFLTFHYHHPQCTSPNTPSLVPKPCYHSRVKPCLCIVYIVCLCHGMAVFTSRLTLLLMPKCCYHFTRAMSLYTCVCLCHGMAVYSSPLPVPKPCYHFTQAMSFYACVCLDAIAWLRARCCLCQNLVTILESSNIFVCMPVYAAP